MEIQTTKHEQIKKKKIPLKNQTWGNSPRNNVEDFDGPRPSNPSRIG
jgi:hypothetical protein